MHRKWVRKIKDFETENPSRNYRKTPRRLRWARAPWPLTVALSRSKLPRSRPLINFRKPRRHFERAFSPDLAVLAPKLARPSVPGTPPASIFEPKTTVFARFFRSMSIRCAKHPTSKKHCKNQDETRFGGPAHRSKTDQKLMEAGLKERSVPQSGLAGDPGRSGDASGALLGRLESILGRYWPLLGRPGRSIPDRSWGDTWASKSHPERVQTRPRNSLGHPDWPRFEFSSMFDRFGFHFCGLSNDFSSIFAEAGCSEDTELESQRAVA